MSLRQLAQAIRQRRQCQHTNARTHLHPETRSVVVLCPDCFRRVNVPMEINTRQDLRTPMQLLSDQP
jgi:hypothetical protein